jgi:hypothetical protein
MPKKCDRINCALYSVIFPKEYSWGVFTLFIFRIYEFLRLKAK